MSLPNLQHLRHPSASSLPAVPQTQHVTAEQSTAQHVSTRRFHICSSHVMSAAAPAAPFCFFYACGNTAQQSTICHWSPRSKQGGCINRDNPLSPAKTPRAIQLSNTHPPPPPKHPPTHPSSPPPLITRKTHLLLLPLCLLLCCSCIHLCLSCCSLRLRWQQTQGPHTRVVAKVVVAGGGGVHAHVCVCVGGGGGGGSASVQFGRSCIHLCLSCLALCLGQQNTTLQPTM